MKPFCLTTLIGVLMLIWANGIQAQPTEAQLNQIGLIKQFSGRRKVDTFKDTFNPIKLITSKVNQIKSALAGNQKLDSILGETWDNTIRQWIIYYKIEYAYNASGHNTLCTYFYWDINTSHWINSTKEENTFDSNGNKTLYTSYYWFSYQWVPYVKEERAYDANGNTIIAQYNWDGTKWIGWSKYEQTYNANGLITLAIYYNWDETTNKWVGTYKYEDAYDTDGNCTLNIFYQWDISISQWVENYKKEYAYNASGNNTLRTSYNWDISISQWIGNEKEESTYDSNGNNTLYVSYKWDLTTNQWVGTGKISYYYSEYNPIPEKHINVYPNPASEYIVFDVPDITESATVEIFDNQGKKVLEQKLLFPGQISISNLANVLYLYRINNSGTIYKGKLIVDNSIMY